MSRPWSATAGRRLATVRRSSDDRAASLGGGSWWVPWAVMAVVIVASLWVGAGAPGATGVGLSRLTSGAPVVRPATPSARISHLESELRCPSCADLSVSQSTEPSALAIRSYVVHAVHRGATDSAIVRFLESRYGPSILMAPKATGPGAAIWWVPAIAVVGAVSAAVLLFRRRGEPAPARVPSDGDRQLVRDAMAGWDGRR